MSSIDTQPAVLTAHPSTPNDAVRRLGVQLRAEKTGILVFQYSLDADMSRVRVPLSGAGGRADALWKHTCFEAFVAPADACGYHEFNFSPSTDCSKSPSCASRWRDGAWLCWRIPLP